MTDATPLPALGRHPDYPLPTLDWPENMGPQPRYWWSRNPQTGALTKVFRSYGDYCD